MSIRLTLMLGALFCAVAVVAGAFGAHALEARLAPDRLALWKTAAQYFVIAGFGLLCSGFLSFSLGTLDRSPGAVALAIGGVIFSGTVAALALGAPRWFGAVTPIGGVFIIAGFLMMAWAAWRGFGE